METKEPNKRPEQVLEWAETVAREYKLCSREGLFES